MVGKMNEQNPMSGPKDDEPVPIPIEDFLDLHFFSPKEVRPLIDEYLFQCQEKGFHTRPPNSRKRNWKLKANGTSIILPKTPESWSLRMLLRKLADGEPLWFT